MSKDKERFYEIDLHTHSFISYDYGKENDGLSNSINVSSIDEFIEQVKDKEDVLPDIMSFTDHGAFSKGLYNRLKEEFESKIFFPGIELNIKMEPDKENYHVVILINPDSVDDFISNFPDITIKSSNATEVNIDPNALITDKRVNTEKLKYRLSDFTKNMYDKKIDFIVIPHSLNKSSGNMLDYLEQNSIVRNGSSITLIQRLLTNALDDNLEYDSNFGEKGKINRLLPIIFNISSSTIYSSDNHDFEEYPKTTHTKMIDGKYEKVQSSKIKTFVYCDGTFESFKQSLMYPETKVFYDGNNIKDKIDNVEKLNREDRKRFTIKSIQVDSETINFSKNNNIILGPKGSGKTYFWLKILSSIIEDKEIEKKLSQYKDITNSDFTNLSISSQDFSPDYIGYITQSKLMDININDESSLENELSKFKITTIYESISDEVKGAVDFLQNTTQSLIKIREELSTLDDILIPLEKSLISVKNDLNFKIKKLNLELLDFKNVLRTLKQKSEDDLQFLTNIEELFVNNHSYKEILVGFENIIYSKEAKSIKDDIEKLIGIKQKSLSGTKSIKTKTNRFKKFSSILESKIFIESNEDTSVDPTIIFTKIFERKSLIRKYQYLKDKENQFKEKIDIIEKHNKNLDVEKEGELSFVKEILYDENTICILNSNIQKTIPYKKSDENQDISNWVFKVSIGGQEINSRPKALESINIEEKKRIFIKKNNLIIKFSQLSPGQRMEIFLMHLIENYFEEKNIIFFDQPEDNLDNETINKVIVKYIRKKRYEKQFFIITHNSQVLINTDPDLIIIPRIDKEKILLKKGPLFDKEVINDAINYIEGGVASMESRFDKMNSQQYENNSNLLRLQEVIESRKYNINLADVNSIKNNNDVYKKVKDAIKKKGDKNEKT